ncbi:MAG TPA: putative Ig domain-containing protein, partial [Bryobacteraceae bacterium]
SGTTPTAITGPVQLPVRISAGGQNSQANVYVWVAPRLKMTPPTGAALTGKIGAAWPAASVTASEGSGPYQYLVTSGVLPSGLTLNPGTGAITGRPDLNTVGSYLIAVTAIDSATPPVSGTATFTLTVGGGLKMTGPSASLSAVALTANTSLTTVTATGGVGSYTYAISSVPSLTNAQLTINPATGVVGVTSTTPAGNYVITVSAQDSTSGTPLVGAFVFTLNVQLKLTGPATAVAVPSLTANASAATVTAAGGIGSYTYGISSVPSLTNAQLTINPATGVIGVTSTTPAGNYVITVSAQDSTPGTPLLGSYSFTLNVTLNMAVTGNGGTISEGSGGGVVAVTATGGSGPYTYAMTSPSSLPANWAFDALTGQITISAGAAHTITPVTVVATDSTSGTALTGTINFNVTVGP